MRERPLAVQAVCGLAVGGALAVTLPRFLFDESDTIHPMGLPAALGLTAWWLAPLLAFLGFVRSLAICAGGATAYVAIAHAGLASVYGTDSSTASIGLFLLPVYLGFGSIVLGCVDALVVRLSAGRRPRRGQSRRIG